MRSAYPLWEVVDMNPCLAVLQEKLEAAGAEYEVEEHPLAFTAQRVAAAEHVSGHQFAKPVVVMADERPCLVVLPASRNVDLDALPARVGAGGARAPPAGLAVLSLILRRFLPADTDRSRQAVLASRTAPVALAAPRSGRRRRA